MAQPVTVGHRDGVVVLTLDRPDVRNAVNGEMARIVADALDELDATPGLCAAVLTGAGGVFSSGMDLKAYLKGDRPSVPGRGLLGFAESTPRKPVIAAVEGWALAAGFEAVLACDLVVAAEGATFGIPEAKRGLVAAGGGLVRLAQRVPYGVAVDLAVTARTMTAQEAMGYGLVNRLVADGTALDGALALAAEIQQNAPLSVRVSKQIIRAARTWDDDDGFAPQQPLLEPLIDSPDISEGARAFAEKRRPVWRES